jgi:hypothetical protein
MRYIVADEQPVSLQDIGKAFAEAGVEYDVDGKETEVTVAYDGKPIGHSTLNVPGDGLFEEERNELIGFAEEGKKAQKRAENRRSFFEDSISHAVRQAMNHMLA